MDMSGNTWMENKPMRRYSVASYKRNAN
jgi:hypothetical protein